LQAQHFAGAQRRRSAQRPPFGRLIVGDGVAEGAGALEAKAGQKQQPARVGRLGRRRGALDTYPRNPRRWAFS